MLTGILNVCRDGELEFRVEMAVVRVVERR